jgi:hypothetical protein
MRERGAAAEHSVARVCQARAQPASQYLTRKVTADYLARHFTRRNLPMFRHAGAALASLALPALAGATAAAESKT